LEKTENNLFLEFKEQIDNTLKNISKEV